MPEIFPTTLHQRADEFAEGPSFASNTLALDNNVWNQTFQLDVTKGVGYIIGRGTTANPQQAEGHVAMRMMDDTATTAVQITGKWRITIRASGSGRLVSVLVQGDLEEADSRDAAGDLKSVENRKPLPITDRNFTTHEYDIWVELKPDSDVTVDTSPDSGNTEIYVDGYTAEKTN